MKLCLPCWLTVLMLTCFSGVRAFKLKLNAIFAAKRNHNGINWTTNIKYAALSSSADGKSGKPVKGNTGGKNNNKSTKSVDSVITPRSVDYSAW